MANIIRGCPDAGVAAVRDALAAYETEHPGSTASLFRENPGAIRVRVVDDATVGMTRSRRHAAVWEFLRSRVGDDLMGEVYQLLVLPTTELGRSLANLDFEEPLPAHG